MIKADLIVKHWLVRGFDVTTHEGAFYVVYYGQGSGYDQVWSTTKLCVRKKQFGGMPLSSSFPLVRFRLQFKYELGMVSDSLISLDIGGQRV